MKTERNSKVVHSGKTREGSFAKIKIPAGWTRLKFSEVFEFIPTNSFSREEMSYEIKSTSYFNIHYGDIHATFSEQILDFKKHISQIPVLIHSPKNIQKDSFLRDGDLIIADASEDYAGVGECIEIVNINGRKVLSGLHTIAARDKAGRTLKGFRAYLLNHPQVSINLKRVATGSKVYGVSKTNIASLTLIIPPLPEQKKIALILSTWDRAIEKTEQLITQKQQLKKGLMQQLLTGKVRFKEFVKSKKMRKTKLGMVPEDWEARTLGDVCIKFLNGGTPSTKTEKFWNGDIPWITGADFEDEKISIVRKYVTKEGVKNSSTSVIPKGWLLLVTRTGVGKMTIAPFDMAISQDLTGVEVNPKMARAEYLLRYLSFRKEKLSQLNQGTSINGITRDVLIGIHVPIPSLKEQKKIALLILGLEKEIEKLEIWRRNGILQKRGLIQKLLTGKTRV